MATFYLDFENGSDTNDGSSWALAWKSMTAGATAARIAPGDTVKIAKSPAPFSVGNALWTGGRLAVATTGSISSSTNAGPIVITANGHGRSTGDIVLIYSHSTNTAANGIWKITYVDANKFSLDGSVGNGVGSGGTWMLMTGRAVVLSTSGLTKPILQTDYATWSTSHGSTAAREDYYVAKQGAYISKITAPASMATSTLYGYCALATATDFSSYQNLSFWLYNEVAIALNNWKICLCSDAAGTTIVDTFPIPAIAPTGVYTPITIAKSGGGNLGATIRSVALYSGTAAPTASKYVRLDNIIACTTGGINLQSLISKNSSEQGGDENWYCIQSINDTIVILDNGPANVVNVGRGYTGTTETVATYCRETSKATNYNTTAGAGQVNDSGTAGNLIEFQGGYNTSSGLQDGETIVEGWNGYGCIYSSSRNYVKLNHLSHVRGNYGLYVSGGTGVYIDDILLCNGARLYGVYLASGISWTINNIRNACGNIDTGFYISSFTTAHTIAAIGNVNGNKGYGLYFNSCSYFKVTTVNQLCNNTNFGFYGTDSFACRIGTILKCRDNQSSGITTSTMRFSTFATIGLVTNNNGHGLYMFSSTGIKIASLATTTANYNYGILFSSSNFCRIQYIGACTSNTSGGVQYASAMENIIDQITTSGNTTRAFNIDSGSYRNYVNRATVGEATVVDGFVTKFDCRLMFTNFGDVTTDHRQYTDGGSIVTDGTVYKSGISWKWVFSNTTRVEDYPIEMSLARIACVANKEVTVKVWVRRNNDTDVGMKILIRKNQLSGITSDVSATATIASSGAWEELTLTFTPTQTGVVEVVAQGYYKASTGNAWVDEMTIEQAA